ncbi:hypothetical protein CW304_06485 [Bacillus sp. UFRGS-B20]|nr:hypothetical protein CW304_06485 [Bacillus sp. UFRGS-B20]
MLTEKVTSTYSFITEDYDGMMGERGERWLKGGTKFMAPSFIDEGVRIGQERILKPFYLWKIVSFQVISSQKSCFCECPHWEAL